MRFVSRTMTITASELASYADRNPVVRDYGCIGSYHFLSMVSSIVTTKRALLWWRARS